MSKIPLIIESEYKTRVQKKSFIVMTILSPVLLVLICCIPILIQVFNTADVRNVTVVDQTGLYRNVFENTDEYTFSYLDSPTTTEQMRNDAQPNAYVVITGNLLNNPSALAIYSHKQTTTGFESHIRTCMEEYLREQKLASFDIPNLQEIIDESNITLNITSIRFDEEGDTQTSADFASFIGMASTLIIYIFLFMYGGMVMASVMQEKTNRIVEVMVSSVKPFDLMLGKIISVGLVGLTQIAIWILLIFGLMVGLGAAVGIPLLTSESASIAQSLNTAGAMTATPAVNPEMAEMMQTLSGINFTQIIVCLVLYFIGGYILYASLFAAIGSAVDNDSDTNQFMIPVTIIILFAFYVGLFSVENPDGGMAWWCSMIPFTSPIVMMVRIPFGVSIWEIILSLVVLYGSAIAMTWVAGRIYRIGILMYGKKVSYKELFKWIKYKA